MKDFIRRQTLRVAAFVLAASAVLVQSSSTTSSTLNPEYTAVPADMTCAVR
jgi:hypothetical protein